MYCCTSAPVHSDRGLDGPRVGSSRSKCVVTTPGAKGPRTPEPDALTAEACTEFWGETKRAASQSLSKSSYLRAGRLGRPHARAVRHKPQRGSRGLANAIPPLLSIQLGAWYASREFSLELQGDAAPGKRRPQPPHHAPPMPLQPQRL